MSPDFAKCGVDVTYKPIPEPPPLPPCPPKPTFCPLQHDSFAAGTLVQTASGLRPIETIKIGDRVLAKDTFSGKDVYRPVTDLFRHTVPFVDRVTLQAADGSQETTGVTPDHRIFVKGRGWTQVHALHVGDKIATENNSKTVTVLSVIRAAGPQLVYNLRIGANHSYFVGTQGVWVHNDAAGLYNALRACALWLQFLNGQPMNDPGQMQRPAIVQPYEKPKKVICRNN